MTRIYKKQEVEENVWTLAQERLDLIFDRYDHVSVSFSGGKDSTALLNSAIVAAERNGRLPLTVNFFDEEAIFFDLEHYARRVSKRPEVNFNWWCLPLKHRNGCSVTHPVWYTWAPEDEHKWCRPLPPEALTSMKGYDNPPPEDRLSLPALAPILHQGEAGTTVELIGLRAEESLTRYRSVANRKADNWIKRHNSGFKGDKVQKTALDKAYPLYDWSVGDVWYAMGTFEWDYCRVYDKMDMLGVPLRNQRISPPYGEEPMKSLDLFHELEPESWSKIVQRVPGAATGSRYAKSALYSFGRTNQKPDNLTWPEYIKRLVERHPDGIREEVAKVLTGYVRRHYRFTKEPILATVPHYATGISWARLAQVADKGDLKGRRSQAWRTNPEDLTKNKARYVEALKDPEEVAQTRGGA